VDRAGEPLESAIAAPARALTRLAFPA
jgi:hypothetical protein